MPHSSAAWRCSAMRGAGEPIEVEFVDPDAPASAPAPSPDERPSYAPIILSPAGNEQERMFLEGAITRIDARLLYLIDQALADLDHEHSPDVFVAIDMVRENSCNAARYRDNRARPARFVTERPEQRVSAIAT